MTEVTQDTTNPSLLITDRQYKFLPGVRPVHFSKNDGPWMILKRIVCGHDRMSQWQNIEMYSGIVNTKRPRTR